ncbi:MAG: tetratricopeptide (TPR) repeat protein, partial [Myxococcota bacterium]
AADGESEIAEQAVAMDAAEAPALDQADEDDSFDLVAELRETLEEEDRADEAEAAEASGPTSAEDGFASIFKDFKSGVAKTLAEDDYETRFDLGIAYRGMELYDDAMDEFTICLGSQSHRLESLHMMGLCAMDLGRFADASNHLEQALAMEEIPAQKEAGLRFDLGNSFEGLEDYPRAKEAFEAAKVADSTLPGIEKCIARVSALVADEDAPVELASEPDGDEGYENFADLVAEIEAEDEPGEAFESFDDVIADVEAAILAEPELDAAAETHDDASVPDAEGGDPAVEAASDKKSKKRKKRISFV